MKGIEFDENVICKYSLSVLRKKLADTPSVFWKNQFNSHSLFIICFADNFAIKTDFKYHQLQWCRVSLMSMSPKTTCFMFY